VKRPGGVGPGAGSGSASRPSPSAQDPTARGAPPVEKGWHPAGARIGIVGLGLMGGSLARDLAALGTYVLGLDLNPDTLRAAAGAGVVHEAMPEGPSGAKLDPSALASLPLDALVLAVPVQAAIPLLAAAAPHLEHVPLVMDVGSTKASISAAAVRLGLGDRFVGSHPMAGSHRSGWEASREGLFQGARVYLCRAPEVGGETGSASAGGAGGEAYDQAGNGVGDEAGSEAGVDVAPETLRRARGLWTAVGGVPELIDAVAHDRLLAWTSHLPQAASTALARALAGAGITPGDLGPGGRDMMRLAGSSASVWTGIALDNASALAEGLRILEAELAQLREWLLSGDGDGVEEFFARGAFWSS